MANEDSIPLATQPDASEIRFRALVENSADPITLLDAERQVVYASPPTQYALGYSPQELLSRNPFQFAHPGDAEVVSGFFTQLLQATGARSTIQFRFRHPDGEWRWLEAVGHNLLDDPDLRGLIVNFREVSTSAQARTRELSTLLELARVIASTLELKPLLGVILDQLKLIVDYTSAAIFTPKGEDLIIQEYRGPISQEKAIRFRLPLEQFEANWEVMHSRKPAIIADIWGGIDSARTFQKLTGEHLLQTTLGHIRSWMGVPLLIKEELIGMLSMAHREPNYYTARHAELALAIASQAAVAIENARLYEQAQDLAALEERQRLARELHDSVSQVFYGIGLGARTARALLDSNPSRLAEPLDYILSLAEAGLTEMRALIFELRPESLANEGLVTTLKKQATALRVRHGIEVETELCDEPDVPFEVKEALYRIARETLHNTFKHARATRVKLKLVCDSDVISLVVSDNGIGFDTNDSFPGHLGLRSMRERAARLGGRLELESAPNQGTRIRVEIPFQPVGKS